MVSSSFVGYATMICTPRDLNYTTFRKKRGGKEGKMKRVESSNMQ